MKKYYVIRTNYGYGWEDECYCSSLKEAKQIKQDYIDNAVGLIGIKIMLKYE